MDAVSAIISFILFVILFVSIIGIGNKLSKSNLLLSDLVELQKEHLKIMRKVYPEQSASVIEERKAKEKK